MKVNTRSKELLNTGYMLKQDENHRNSIYYRKNMLFRELTRREKQAKKSIQKPQLNFKFFSNCNKTDISGLL